MMNYILLIACISLIFATQMCLSKMDDVEAKLYLQRYGYLDEDIRNVELVPEPVYVNAIKDFQRFAGINVSGKLDETTMEMMSASRCGVKDLMNNYEEVKRISSSTTEIPRTFKITKKNSVDSDEAPNLCQDAKIDAITRISNGDTFVFKGEYYWKIETNGLANDYPKRITADWGGLPGDLDAAFTWDDGKTFFFKGSNYWRFHDMKMDDAYPKRIEVGFAGIPENIDAAFVWSGNGKTYFFKGKEYWKYDSKFEPPVSSRYPKPINNWSGLPDNVDAAFNWENGQTYFFKGSEYFRFNNLDFEVDSEAKPSFPRQTTVWWYSCESEESVKNAASSIDLTKKPFYVGLMHSTMEELISVSSSSSNDFKMNNKDDDLVTAGSLDTDINYLYAD